MARLHVNFQVADSCESFVLSKAPWAQNSQAPMLCRDKMFHQGCTRVEHRLTLPTGLPETKRILIMSIDDNCENLKRRKLVSFKQMIEVVVKGLDLWPQVSSSTHRESPSREYNRSQLK